MGVVIKLDKTPGKTFSFMVLLSPGEKVKNMMSLINPNVFMLFIGMGVLAISWCLYKAMHIGA